MKTQISPARSCAASFTQNLLHLLGICTSIGAVCLGAVGLPTANAAPPPKTAVDFLADAVDAHNSKFYVYNDLDDGLNRFPVRALMGGGASVPMPTMEEGCTDAHSGVTSIKVTAFLESNAWRGFAFQSGTLASGSTVPSADISTGPDLTGATTLKFWAKGAAGGERVKFYMETATDGQCLLGSNGYVTLTSQWKEYTITLNGTDLSRVPCGFAWVTSALDNPGKPEIVFYLDDIRYEFSTPRNRPVLLRSYEPLAGDALNGFAYTYDNAVAAIALARAGRFQQARQITDALVYALDNDRYYTDGRLRNGYANGFPESFPEWKSSLNKPFARLPGFTSPSGDWWEDFYSDSTSTGNVAWALLAFCEMAERDSDATRSAAYFAAAQKAAAFVLAQQDTAPQVGFFAGHQGFDGTQTRAAYKSTEHNIDLISAFRRLSRLADGTGDTTAAVRYAAAAESARDFVLSMYDGTDGGFYVGTTDDGVTTDTSIRALDCQSWAVLALLDDTAADTPEIRRVLDYINANFSVGAGFDFDSGDLDGIWNEGVAQSAVAFLLAGDNGKYVSLLNYLDGIAEADGSIVAAIKVVPDGKAGVTTGIYLEGIDENGDPRGTEWLYAERIHIGATAWLALAKLQENPFAPVVAPPDGTDSWETHDLAGLATKGVKLTAPKSLVVPKGVKLAKGTKATYTWTDAAGNVLLDSKGKLINSKTYTAKISGEYFVTLSYTPIDPVTKAPLPEVTVPAVPFGKVKIFVAPKIAKLGGFVVEQLTTQTGIVNSVVEGETLRLTVTLADGTGTGPLNYIWYRNGVALANIGKKNTFDTTDSMETAAFGAKSASYTVVVETVERALKKPTKPLASVKSKAIKPKVIIPPTVRITTAPAKLSVIAGKPLTLTAKATGTAKLTYTWYKAGDPVPLQSGTKSSYKIGKTTLADAGTYRVEVRNAAGVTYTDEAFADVAVTAPI